LTFACYGTLIDWESGMTAALGRLTSRLDRLFAKRAQADEWAASLRRLMPVLSSVHSDAITRQR
jgi:hypothetical protein